MSNDNIFERLFKQQTMINKLILDGNRDPEKIAKILQQIIDECGSKSTPLAVQTEKFALLVDLGIITVPDNYVHGTCLDVFGKQNCKKFYYYNDKITDKNFSNPSRILKPGDKLHVRAFKQIVTGMTTSEERMAFLATQKAVHTGAQGASLVFKQKRDQLPKGFWYASFDEKERLWKDADGDRRVTSVDADSGGDFRFDLGDFECVWSDDDAFFCFCDLSGEALAKPDILITLENLDI